MTQERILLAHGAGGIKTQNLIKKIFQRYLGNAYLQQELDAAVIKLSCHKLAISTDSFVINPIFFPGGDIGKLAVCGTVNDLAVMGAKPLYLTLGLILEEGFPIKDLEEIVMSIGEACRNSGVQIVTGDTKVVERGACDKIFINTTGIGTVQPNIDLRPQKMVSGDKIIVSGSIGDHGTAILATREGLDFSPPIISDCTNLNYLIDGIIASGANLKCMRDPTRGGIVTTLNELAQQGNVGIRIMEEKLPIDPQVKSACSMLGIEPLYLANEGKVIVVVTEKDVAMVINEMKRYQMGKNAQVIGEVTDGHPKKVVMETELGTIRVLHMLEGNPLPRID